MVRASATGVCRVEHHEFESRSTHYGSSVPFILYEFAYEIPTNVKSVRIRENNAKVASSKFFLCVCEVTGNIVLYNQFLLVEESESIWWNLYVQEKPENIIVYIKTALPIFRRVLFSFNFCCCLSLCYKFFSEVLINRKSKSKVNTLRLNLRSIYILISNSNLFVCQLF